MLLTAVLFFRKVSEGTGGTGLGLVLRTAARPDSSTSFSTVRVHESREYAAFERERIPRHDCAGDVAALGLVPPLVISPPPFPVFVRGLALSVCALCVGRSRVQEECRSASDECRPLLLRPSSMHWGGGRGRWR